MPENDAVSWTANVMGCSEMVPKASCADDICKKQNVSHPVECRLPRPVESEADANARWWFVFVFSDVFAMLDVFELFLAFLTVSDFFRTRQEMSQFSWLENKLLDGVFWKDHRDPMKEYVHHERNIYTITGYIHKACVSQPDAMQKKKCMCGFELPFVDIVDVNAEVDTDRQPPIRAVAEPRGQGKHPTAWMMHDR